MKNLRCHPLISRNSKILLTAGYVCILFFSTGFINLGSFGFDETRGRFVSLKHNYSVTLPTGYKPITNLDADSQSDSSLLTSLIEGYGIDSDRLHCVYNEDFDRTILFGQPSDKKCGRFRSLALKFMKRHFNKRSERRKMARFLDPDSTSIKKSDKYVMIRGLVKAKKTKECLLILAPYQANPGNSEFSLFTICLIGPKIALDEPERDLERLIDSLETPLLVANLYLSGS